VLRLKFRSLFRKRTVEWELDEELQFHFEQQVAEYMAAGIPRDEAERAARRLMGGFAQIKEECRDARGLAWILDAAGDVRYALRTFGRSPGFAITAVLTLALGIGANTAVFSIADAVLLKMLPVPEPDRLFQILHPHPLTLEYFEGFSFVTYREMQEAAGRFAGLTAESYPRRSEATIDGVAEKVRETAVSGNYFGVLGVKTVLGRAFDPAIDGELGRHPEAIISYGYWKRRFQGDPNIIGRTVRIRDISFQVIGVSGPRFSGLQVGSMTDVWTPVIMGPERQVRNRNMISFRILGRLRPGVAVEQAIAPVQEVFHRAAIDSMRNAPEGTPQSLIRRMAEQKVKQVPASKGISQLREQYGEPLKIVFGVVGLVLLLTCGNVANLLLARANARQREMAVRVSMGAGRLRLLRQLLTESLLLAICAAALGLLAARWTVPVLVSMLAPADTPVQLATGVDLRVLAFTAAVSLLSAILFGSWPAIRATRLDIHSALKSGTQLAGTRGRLRGGLLVSIQMAISLVLLIVSALFVRTLLNLKAFDPGFDRRHVILAEVQYKGPIKDSELVRAWGEAVRRVMTIPGVEAASASLGGPFIGSYMHAALRVQGSKQAANLSENWFVPVSANYFSTRSAKIVAGRDFDGRDFVQGAPRVAIVSETLARRFFGNEPAVGKKMCDFEFVKPQWAEVIGVVKDMKFESLRSAPPSMFYFPFTQMEAIPRSMTLEMRARRDSVSIGPEIRREVAVANPGFAAGTIESQDQLIDKTLIRERLLATVGSFFGALAILLAGIGLYGTMSYSVSRRTQEIGVRMALGARREQVLRMVLSEALVTVGLGAVAGVAAALAIVRAIAGLVFGIQPRDPLTAGAAVAVLAGASISAALIPALRAARTDPMNALRNE
jgi:predicted permease